MAHLCAITNEGASQGIGAEYVNLDNIVDPSYITKNGLNQEFYDYLAVEFAKRLRACGNKVPVVTGGWSKKSIYIRC